MRDVQSVMLKALSRMLSWCPRPLQWHLSWLIAQAGSLFSVRSAATTRANLAYCFPGLREAERNQLVKKSLRETAMLLLESGMIFHWPQQRLDSLIGKTDGLELLRAAVDDKRSVLLLVPHFGNWEFLALYLGRFDLVALYDPPRLEALELPIKASRERTGARLLPLNRTGLKTSLRTLRGGGLLGVLPDQVPDRNAGLHVPFFGHPALTMTLVHRLICETSPIVLLGSAIRTDAGFDLTFREVSPVISSTNPAEALSAINVEIEKLISAAPEQYQWEYKRFKSPPDEAARIY